MKEKVKTINKRSILKLLAILAVAALMVYCAFTLFSNYADISRLRAQAAEYNTEYTQQLAQNEKTRAILDSDNFDEYIEQKAREKGYAGDGEMVFYDISSSK